MRSFHAALARLTIAAALWAAVVVSGQELTLTPITDTLYNANGTRAEGSIEISWKSFTAGDGSAVAQNSVELDIVDGIVALALAPNEGASPEGTTYRVQYRLRRSEKFTEFWIVPASSEPVSIADIRVQTPPTPGMSFSMSQVSGLPSALNGKADRAAGNTFTAPQLFKEDAAGTPNPLLGLQKHDGSASIYFRLPPLSNDVTYTLPPSDGSPNQALTTDGNGALFWSSSAGAGEGSAYEVLQQNGSSVPQRTVANFTTGFTVSDNSGQLRTDITPNFGTAAGTITQGNDARLSNARTPLAHASTHGTGGSDPVTPLSMGALNRTNDFMVGAAPATPVFKVQGASGQTAALQEWRDGAGSLLASITALGNGFFRELGIAAPTGGTTVSQFFEIGGLRKFALSATDGVFDILRYDNAGAFLDRPLRIFRNGQIETTVSLKVTDASVGSGALGLTGNYIELQSAAAPSNPASGFGRLFLNSSNGQVSVKKSSGTVVSLEGGGSGGSGDVSGPASSTNNAIVVFDGTTGKLIKQSDCSITGDNLSCGSGSTPWNLTGFTDNTPPAAPAAANQFTSYIDRSNGSFSWIINGGAAQTAVTTTGTQTITGKTIDGDNNTLQDIPNSALVTIGISKGGTGQTTQTAGMDALSPTTTKGDLLVDNGTSVIRLAVGSKNQVLVADSAQAAGVKWAAGPLILGIESNTANECESSTSWNTLGSGITIPADTLAVGNVLRIQALVDRSGTAGAAATRILVNTTPLGEQDTTTDSNGQHFAYSCVVESTSLLDCGGRTVQLGGSGTEVVGAANPTLTNLSTSFNIAFQHRLCDSGDLLNLDFSTVELLN